MSARWLAVAFGAGLLLGFGARAALDRLEAPGFRCSSMVERTVPSPDGVLMAFVSVTDCGATTPYVTTVGVTGVNGDPAAVEPLFSAQAAREIRVEWTGLRDLLIHDDGAPAIRKAVFWHGVSVSYAGGEVGHD